MDLKVAAIYMPEIHVGEPEKNRVVLEKVLRDCFESNPGIDLAVCPELANTGLHLVEYEYWRVNGEHLDAEDLNQSKEGKLFIEEAVTKKIPCYLEEIPSGKTTKLLERLASEYNAHLVCGIGELYNGLRCNSAVFISPLGYIGTYRQHEKQVGEYNYWTTGYGDASQSVYELAKNGVKIGILICVEMAISRIADAVVPQVSMVAVPANWYDNTYNSLYTALQRFDHKYRVPVVVGNRGKELFQGTPHKSAQAYPQESTGSCAVISTLGTIRKECATVVETITI